MTHLSWNRQLALAATLFALGTAAYWLEYKHKPEKEASEENSKKLFALKDASVRSITLMEGGKNTLFSCLDLSNKLCKPGDHSKWEIQEPSKFRADDANVNALLSSLSSSSSESVIDLKDETPEKRASLLKDYGLTAQDRQSARKVLVSTENEETLLYLGQPHPIGESFFAMKEKVAAGQKPGGNADENSVYLVPNFFKTSIDHDLKYWRNKKLLTLAASEVDSFSVQGSKGNFSGARKDGKWILSDLSGKSERNLSDTQDLPGDSENIETFLSSASYLTAKEFVSDQKEDTKAKAALKNLKPALSLTFQKAKGNEKEAPAPVTLTLYSSTSQPSQAKLYAAVSNLDPLFELDSASKDRLDKAVKDLRMSKLISSLDRFSAKRIEFTGKPLGSTPILLTNGASDHGKWTFQPEKTEADETQVTLLLEKLSGSRILNFLSGSAFPAGEEEGIQLNLGDETTPSKQQFAFWKKGEILYARDLKSKRKEAYLMDASLLKALPLEKKGEKEYFKKSPTSAATLQPTAPPSK